MSITREKKHQILRQLKERLQQAVSVVFVNFRGLSVAQMTKLRQDLKDEAVGFTVAKKTLLRLALAEQSVPGVAPELPGEIALAYGADSLAPARGIFEFEKQHKDTLKILGGIFEGKYVGADFMLRLAAIPPREVLYGQLVGLLAVPLRRLVVVLDQISKK